MVVGLGALRARGHTAGVMAAAGAVTALGALPPFLIGAQAVFVRAELGFDLIRLGMAISAFFAAAAVTALAGGGLIDRIGARAGLLLAGTLVAAGGVAMVLLVADWTSLVACMLLLGVGNAACQISSNLSVAQTLPSHRRGLGFGVKQAAIPLAIMLAGLAVPTVGRLYSWRFSFGMTAVAGLVVLTLALLTRPVHRARADASAHGQDRPPLRPLLIAGLGITCGSAAANFLGAYLASWADRSGLTPSQAGLLIAAGSGTSIVVRIVLGHRADGRHGANLPVVAVQMFVGAGCLVGLSTGWPAAVVGFGFAAFAIGWSWPGLFLYAVARVGRDAPARASAIVQAGAFAGGALGPIGFGLLVGTAGFEIAWWSAAGAFAVAGVLVLLARRGLVVDLVARPPRVPLSYGGGRGQPARRTTQRPPDRAP